MNTRKIIIVIALAVPILGLAILSHYNAQPPIVIAKVEEPVANAAPVVIAERKLPDLNTMISNERKTLADWEAMTSERYQQLRTAHPDVFKPSYTLEGYKLAVRNRITKLEAMTPQQWSAISYIQWVNISEASIVEAQQKIATSETGTLTSLKPQQTPVPAAKKLHPKN
jgi:Flp pilus assembly protein CpaB